MIANALTVTSTPILTFPLFSTLLFFLPNQSSKQTRKECRFKGKSQKPHISFFLLFFPDKPDRCLILLLFATKRIKKGKKKRLFWSFGQIISRWSGGRSLEERRWQISFLLWIHKSVLAFETLSVRIDAPFINYPATLKEEEEEEEEISFSLLSVIFGTARCARAWISIHPSIYLSM